MKRADALNLPPDDGVLIQRALLAKPAPQPAKVPLRRRLLELSSRAPTAVYDLCAAFACGWSVATNDWEYRRHLRRGGCPDELPF